LTAINDIDHLAKNAIVGVLDIETGSLRNKAHIFTIGLVIGNVVTGEILGEYYYRVSAVDQEGRIIDNDTIVGFWGDSSKVSLEAQKEIFNTMLERMPLSDALLKLNSDIVEFKNRHKLKRIDIMGNGSEFDNAIVIEACHEFDIKPAWSHSNNQSLRTLVWLGRLALGIDPKYDIPFDGVVHNALDDCRHEFKYAAAIVKSLLSAIKGGGVN
jgi:hypothetical protein